MSNGRWVRPAIRRIALGVIAWVGVAALGHDARAQHNVCYTKACCARAAEHHDPVPDGCTSASTDKPTTPPTTPPTTTDWKACVVLEVNVRGTYCSNADSQLVQFRNTCKQAADIKVCLERSVVSATQTRWDCATNAADPGELTPSSRWVCASTGHYFMDARAAGSKQKLLNPE